jgi:hypothetical protein
VPASPPAGVIGPPDWLDPTPSCVLVVSGAVLFLFLKWRLQENAQRLLVPSLVLLNEMVAVRKISRLRRVVIQRRSSLKALGAELFFSGSCACV